MPCSTAWASSRPPRTRSKRSSMRTRVGRPSLPIPPTKRRAPRLWPNRRLSFTWTSPGCWTRSANPHSDHSLASDPAARCRPTLIRSRPSSSPPPASRTGRPNGSSRSSARREVDGPARLVTDVSVSSRTTSEPPLTERQWVRRGELLEAARRVFERDGYHGTTVSAVVQAAGLSQGAFYLYFADKKGVFAALQDEMATLLRRRIYSVSRDEPDALLRLEAGVRADFGFYEEDPAWNRRLTNEGLGIDQGFQARQTH